MYHAFSTVDLCLPGIMEMNSGSCLLKKHMPSYMELIVVCSLAIHLKLWLISQVDLPKNIDFKDDERYKIKNDEDIDRLWDQIMGADEQGFLISAETEGEDVYTKEGGLSGSGLVPGHAYSVIKAVEANDVRLLNIRNPWGRFEWDGAWSDKDKRWTKEMIKLVNPILDEHDGSFWMCIEDFVKNYTSINICKLKAWEEVRVKGLFLKVQHQEVDYIDDVISRFYYRFQIKTTMRAYIGIHQEDQRVVGSHLRPLLDITYILFKFNKDQDVTVYKAGTFVRERELQEIVTLTKGHYILVPITTGCLLQPPNN